MRKRRFHWRALARAGKVATRLRAAFPLTFTGAAVGAGCLVAAYHFGFGQLDLILLSLGIAGASVVASSVVMVLIAALVVWLRARNQPERPPLRLECGHAMATGFRLGGARWIPMVEVTWKWVSPIAAVSTKRNGHHLVEEVEPSARDHFTEISRLFEIRDVFGFAHIGFRVVEQRAGRFAPWVGSLEQMHVIQGLSGGDDMSHPEGHLRGDMYDMRRYAAGDPIRFVLWKVFAKTRALMVRTPEPAVSQDRRTIAYVVAGDGDEPAAGAARVAVNGNSLGTEWVLGADGCGDVASSADQAIDVLARSARAVRDDAGALAAFMSRVAHGSTSRAVVFVPARPGPWMERVAAAAAASPGRPARVDFIVCTDGMEPEQRRSVWKRSAAESTVAARGAANPVELAQVVKVLSGTGANVLIVDRPNGRLFSGRQLEQGML